MSPPGAAADPLELDNAILRNLLKQTTRAYEQQMAELFAEKELAQVTLASIGDGVLTTDAQGKVEFLNPVAEKLTGWQAGQALGQPLAAVFRLVGESAGGELATRLRHCLEAGESLRLVEVILESRDERRYAIESVGSPIRDHDGRIVGAVLVFQDVSDKRLMALQLAHQATHDELTGLLNRQSFDGHLQRALDEARAAGTTHALCYMDLDQFKLVNDTCGHLAGDELLRRMTALLQDTLADTDLVARLGGDEFGMLLPRCSLPTAEYKMKRLFRALQRFRFNWQDKSFAVGASIGLVPITRDYRTIAHLMSAADHACYVAKEKGRNRMQIYQEDDATFVRRHGEMNWVVRIQETLENDRFRLFCQTIQPLSERAARGLFFEVLLRMVESDGRVHLPSDLIRAAERYGLMRSVDRWVIHNSIRAVMDQPASFLEHLATCAINLSAMSLSDEAFLGFVEEEIAASGVPPQKLCFEITETAAIENLAQAQRVLHRLSGLGVRFALDDFGTGMSSFSYLREIPVSFLKIDGKFIKDIVNDSLDRAMVESINQLGHVMGIQTVAEAVSGSAAVDRLRSLGVDYAQGNWLAAPRPIAEVCAAQVAAARAGGR
ncbi:MAG TPA: EAL domain-containing protein [Thermoanaerobaculia bacterium]|nr:EAL domain-containing protein [Thermoanaerobaculia bacterium]